ncbi:MAG: hypothetical protein KY453_02370 [Gemmatimonadetes bacterium]|nr:hypothetical protein [Gemmatimonadota bacterium]
MTAVDPPPTAEALESLPLHVVLRGWPETLVPLRRAGVDLRAEGARSLAGLPAAERLVAACLDATAWRGRPR